MNTKFKGSKSLWLGIAVAAITVPASARPVSASAAMARHQGGVQLAVAYPWAFQNGTKTSRMTAETAVEEIGQKAGFSSAPRDLERSTWKNSNFPANSFGHLPSKRTLEAYGQAIHATKILYGSVAWNTRSIWVNLGPKTISTATVDVYVFDVQANKVVYKNLGVIGRSDEKSNVWKLAGDVLVTPIVTAVSGGPATPREQRAAQIAIGTAYRSWVRSGNGQH